jgi:hypothetical protein
MGKLNGRFLRMVQWLHDMDFEILGNVIKSPCTITYLSIIGYTYIIFPFVTLILWFCFLINDAGTNDKKYNMENPTFMAAISVVLLSLALFLVLFAVTKIQWNNYRFKLSHTYIFSFAYFTFTAWQFMIVFSSIKGEG